MALSTTFGVLTAATGGELDVNFAEVGALTTLRTGATGTNSIVLTPAANQPAVSGYGLPNPVKFSFTAPATSTGAVTLEILSFGFLPVYTPNGVQATTGTLVSGNYYEVTYTTGAIYNSGAGAWVLSSYQSGTGLVVLAGSSVRGWKSINNAGTPSTKIDISFQQACLVSSTGTPAFLGSLSATIDLTTGTVTSTANGMDGESRPASGWVYIYAISTGSGMAGLGTTTSPLAGPPTLPAGYAYYAYVEARFCDGSSNLMQSRQLGSEAQYVVIAATNTAKIPQMITGISGSVSAPTYTAVAVGNFVPPTAGSIEVLLFFSNTGSAIGCMAAPNNSYGADNSTTNPPPLSYFSNLSGSINVGGGIRGQMVLESTNVYYASSVAATGLCAVGWTDYVSAAA